MIINIIEVIKNVIVLSWNPFDNKDLWKCADNSINLETLEESLGLSHNIFSLETFYLFPELVLIAFIVPMWVVLIKPTDDYRNGLMLLVLVFYLIVFVSIGGYASQITDTFQLTIFNETLAVSTSSYMLKYAVLGGSLVTLIAIVLFDFLSDSKIHLRLFTLTAVLTPFFILLQASANLISIFLVIEIISIILYTIAIQGGGWASIEAAAKYFIQGAVTSAMFISSVIFMLNFFGTGSISSIFELLRTGEINSIKIFAINYFLLTLMFKLVSFPGYLWAEAVYKNVSYAVLLVFTVISKFSFISFFVNIYWDLIPKVTGISYSYLILVIVLVSLAVGLIGGIVAISKNNLKQFIIFTGVNQIGFILIPSIFFLKTEYRELSLYYTSIYLIANLIFIFALVVISILNSTSMVDIERLDELAKFIASSKNAISTNFASSVLNRFFVYAMLVSVWSIAGLPPFGGFFTKVAIWRSFVDDILICENPEIFINLNNVDLNQLSILLILVVVASIISSIVSVYYYFELFRPAFFIDLQNVDTQKSSMTLDIEKKSLLILIAILIGYLIILLLLPVFSPSEYGLFFVPQYIKNFVPTFAI